MAGLQTINWSGRSGSIRRPSWIPALDGEGSLAGPRLSRVREVDATLPGECDPLAQGAVPGIADRPTVAARSSLSGGRDCSGLTGE